MEGRKQECTICKKTCDNPVLLSCLHSFCYTCLEEYVRLNLCNGKFICLNCKISVELPNEGLRALQTNSHILTNATVERYCSKHPGQDIQLVCQTCDVYMCLKCKAFDHDTHPSKPMDKLAGEVKEKLWAMRSLCDERLKQLNLFEQKGDSNEKSLKEQEHAEFAAIDSHYAKLLSVLETKVLEMKDKVKSTFEYIRKENSAIMEKVTEESKFYSANKNAITEIDQASDIAIVQKGSELVRIISKAPSPTDQATLKHLRKKLYTPAEINVQVLGALMGSVEIYKKPGKYIE